MFLHFLFITLLYILLITPKFFPLSDPFYALSSASCLLCFILPLPLCFLSFSVSSDISNSVCFLSLSQIFINFLGTFFPIFLPFSHVVLLCICFSSFSHFSPPSILFVLAFLCFTLSFLILLSHSSSSPKLFSLPLRNAYPPPFSLFTCLSRSIKLCFFSSCVSIYSFKKMGCPQISSANSNNLSFEDLLQMGHFADLRFVNPVFFVPFVDLKRKFACPPLLLTLCFLSSSVSLYLLYSVISSPHLMFSLSLCSSIILHPCFSPSFISLFFPLLNIYPPSSGSSE
jgi:hypothetical protein